MKNINLTDEDYNILMELSKELQVQERDHQGYPRFWSPRSTRKTIGTVDDVPVFYNHALDGMYSPEEISEEYPEEFANFLKDYYTVDTKYEDISEDWWISEVEDNIRDCTLYYQKDEEVCENNFSFFYKKIDRKKR